MIFGSQISNLFLWFLLCWQWWQSQHWCWWELLMTTGDMMMMTIMTMMMSRWVHFPHCTNMTKSESHPLEPSYRPLPFLIHPHHRRPGIWRWWWRCQWWWALSTVLKHESNVREQEPPSWSVLSFVAILYSSTPLTTGDMMMMMMSSFQNMWESQSPLLIRLIVRSWFIHSLSHDYCHGNNNRHHHSHSHYSH